MKNFLVRVWDGDRYLDTEEFMIYDGDVKCTDSFTSLTCFTIEQYWKKDSKDRKVFVGDIVHIHCFLFDGTEVEKEHKAIVGWSEDGFTLNFIEGSIVREYTGYNKDGEDCILMATDVYGLHDESFTKIGNIHDKEEEC